MMTSDFAVMIHCLCLLAVNREKRLTSKEIARSVNINSVRIRNILRQLGEKGFVSSREGKGGGFQIAVPPEMIRMDEIYTMTSPNLLDPHCPDCDKSCNVGRNIENVLNTVLNGASSHLLTYFNRINLKDILKNLTR
jgi:Rrf2 family protein